MGGVRAHRGGAESTAELAGEALPEHPLGTEQAGTGGGLEGQRAQPLSPFGLTVWPQGQTDREGPRVLEGLAQGGGNCTRGDPHSFPCR